MLESLERLILDPISEAPPYQVAANRPLEVTGRRAPSPEGHGIFLSEHQYPRPEAKTTFATSRDSEGEKRFGEPKLGNRKIPIKVYISEAQGVGAMTNVATNPAGEVVKKFNDGPDFVVTRELGTAAVPSLTGEYRDKHAYDGAGGVPAVGSYSIPALPGAGTYTFSAFVWIPSSWDGGKIILTNSGTFVGVELLNYSEADLTKRDQWQRLTMTAKFVAGDLSGVLDLYALAMPSSAGTGIVYSDGVQIESGSVATAFAYGDTPGCYWNGKPNESTSTRVGSGSDKKRFIRCLYDIQEKIEKLADEGGTLKRILPDGSWMVFDIEEASFVGEWSKPFNQGQQEFSFELICRPGARLAPVTYAAREEKTLPILTFTEVDVPGNMDALGDLLVEDIQGVDRAFAAVALASRFLDTSANAEPFYEAEGRTRLSGAVISGATIQATLFDEFTPYLSTRSSAGTYTTHVGAQKIFARVKRPNANTGEFAIKLEYAQGDLLRWRGLDPVTFGAGALEEEWIWVDLGVVRLNGVAIGTQRWEGRVSMRSTVTGDTAQIDSLAILPCEEFYGEARALSIPSVLGPQIARDNFNHAVGVLTGKVATAGGTWSYPGGDTEDFATNGSTATRMPAAFDVSGANNGPLGSFHTVMGRYARLGVATQAAVMVSCDVDVPPSPYSTDRRGVFGRYVDMNNMLMASLLHDYTSGGSMYYSLQVHKKKGGAWTNPASANAPGLTPGAMVTLTLYCAADGSGWASLKSGESQLAYTSWKADADLATAGTLQTGGYGIYHAVSAHPKTPGGDVPFPAAVFDSFTVRNATEAALTDAAIYANKDLRIRWDKALREASDGSGSLSDVGVYRGDRLLIPPSGRESRPVRVSVLTTRGLPNEQGDPGADDTKATLTVTPRVTEVPEPV